ncbi:MAG: signal peptidase I [Eubacteriaceae bacterium]|nr:signal peptidase I [Eubacteriaceae bacterium]
MENYHVATAKPSENTLKHEIYEWIKCILFAVIFAIIVRTFIFAFVVVEQTSMHPTLKPSDRLGVSKITYTLSKPKRGDIAIIRINPETNYVKRVIGVAGDSVEIIEQTVYINGEAIDEPYIDNNLIYSDFEMVIVPEGCYFVMGDNRPDSLDSRSARLGFIGEDDFIGKVAFRLSPFAWLY